MRDFLRKITPDFLLEWYRKSKKNKRNKELSHARQSGNVITKRDLIDQLKGIGIEQGDTVLVHSSLSKIGFVEGGADAVVDAFLELVGEEGHVLMPNSPNASLQLDYIRQLEVFDVVNDKSKLGAITEVFRRRPNAVRSEHPTEPVSCIGPNSNYFVGGHFGELTPYTSNSPFRRVSEAGGKILYLGVTFDNAGTNLHTLEDAVPDFPYPVYHEETFEVKVKSVSGEIKSMKTKVHNPEQSAKRKCDGLIPLFIDRGILTKHKIGEANALLVDAKNMLDCMIKEFSEHGVTMYTPKGIEK